MELRLKLDSILQDGVPHLCAEKGLVCDVVHEEFSRSKQTLQKSLFPLDTFYLLW